MNAPDLLDLKEAASLLHVGERTLARWHALRAGPPRVRAGRRVLYRRDDLLTWLRREDYGREAATG